MSKTAEEMLNDKRINFSSALQVQLVHNAMHEFADQEVGAYKVRLRAEFELKAKSEYEGEEREWFLRGVKALIDTVK